MTLDAISTGELREWAESRVFDEGELGMVARGVIAFFADFARYAATVDAYMLENQKGRVTALDFELLTQERSIRG